MTPQPNTVEVLWRSADIAAATGGRATQPFEASGVAIDNRTLSPGDLFIALKGDNHDGHDFVGAAFDAGASAALVSRVQDNLPANTSLLIAPDTFEALWALARAARARTSARLVAVTGSVGKTGTKEMLARIFEAHGPTAATAGNFNNHIGAPLSLARFAPSSRYGVFELGMNHADEIRPLTKLVKPHVALITTVQRVHLENFGSIEGIADAKAEIFEGLTSDGTALINRDDTALFDRLLAAAKRAGAARVISFGAHRDADARLTQWYPDDDGGTVEAEIAGQALCYRISLAGRHWALNSVSALAAAHAAGADLARGARALAGLTPLQGRGARHAITVAGGTADLINESYNASPISIAAAIMTLGSRQIGPEGRRIAVLGDMLELGPDAARFHAELADAIERAGIDLVFAAGPLMTNLFSALPESRRGAHAPNSSALLPLVRSALRPGDVVLVKGSHGSRTDLIVAGLLADVAGIKTEASRAL